jgi:hypothetical protein
LRPSPKLLSFGKYLILILVFSSKPHTSLATYPDLEQKYWSEVDADECHGPSICFAKTKKGACYPRYTSNSALNMTATVPRNGWKPNTASCGVIWYWDGTVSLNQPCGPPGQGAVCSVPSKDGIQRMSCSQAPTNGSSLSPAGIIRSSSSHL